MKDNVVILDPADLDNSIRQLADIYSLPAEVLVTLRRIVALYPRPVQLYVDDTRLYENLVLADRFTFDMQTDELVLFSRDPDTLMDAMIEMAMYLAGFATMMGNEEEWVIEFVIGAWKPVKNRIKRQLGIPVSEQPRFIVGLPPGPDQTPSGDTYPFRTLVSHYTLASFQQMTTLAARDDVAVYFPPETHPKVLEAYVYVRRAMQEVAQGLGLTDHQTFNARLIQAIEQLQKAFTPSALPTENPPDEQGNTGSHKMVLNEHTNRLNHLLSKTSHESPSKSEQPDPFEEFIEQLFADEDGDDGDGSTA